MKTPEPLNLEAFFKILGKEGSVELLAQAGDELTSGKDAIRCIGLSQKLYYSRLVELRHLGLIEKEGLRKYRTTKKGRLVLDLRKRMGKALDQNRSSLPVESRVISTYSGMVETLSKQIDEAQNRIKLATRYVDATIAKSAFDAVDRNVSVQVLYKSGKTHLGKLALELITLLKSDIASQLERLWKNTRVADVPFSFTVIDGHWSGIELIGADNTFLAALEFEGESTSVALSLLFRHYFRIGTVFPRFW